MQKALRTYWPVLVFMLLAIGAPVLSNNKLLIVKDESGWSFPAFSGKFSNAAQDFSFSISAPVPFSPNQINLDETGRPPLYRATRSSFNETHWLGTDAIGRDVLANIIHGFRTSITISALAMIIALVLGLSIGAASGFWDSKSFGINPFQLAGIILLIVFIWNLILVLSVSFGSFSTCVLLFMILILVVIVLRISTKIVKGLRIRKSIFPKFLTVKIHPGSWLMWLINSISALPAYFVLLTMLALFPNPGLSSIALVLGLLMWTDIARLTRAEIIRLKTTNMAESAKSLGYSDWRLMLKHLLPNAMQPALTTIGFGIGGAILAEAFLSFVGIAPAEMISWGSLIAQAREYPSFWWLSVFPGTAIFLVILVFYRFSLKLGKQKAHVH
jgi:peptide/nickel transport system permease protein